QTASHLATDAASGAVVLAGVTIAGKGGVFVRKVIPSLGPKVVLPLPTVSNDWDNGLSGRIGAPGVYLAYADGKSAYLYRYGGSSKTLGRGAFTSATVCAGPEGRLWVAWGDTADGLFVTRSNRAASAFEPMQKLRAPSGSGLTYLQCEGSAGPVDLFADSGGFFHAHLLAQLAGDEDDGDGLGPRRRRPGGGRGGHSRREARDDDRERPGDGDAPTRLVLGHRHRSGLRVRGDQGLGPVRARRTTRPRLLARRAAGGAVPVGLERRAVGKGHGSAEIEQLHARGSDVTGPTNSPPATSRPLPDHGRDERRPTVKRTAKEGAWMHRRTHTLALAATVALAAAALLGGAAPAGAVPAGT